MTFPSKMTDGWVPLVYEVLVFVSRVKNKEVGENAKLKCHYQCIPVKEFSRIMTWFVKNSVCNEHFKRLI